MIGRYAREYAAWIWLLAAVLVVAVLEVVASQPSSPPPPLAVSSDQRNGALAAYRWLSDLGYRVEREGDGTLGLDHLQPGRDTLVVISPRATFSDRLVQSLLDWVRSGGRLVLSANGDTGYGILSTLDVQISDTLPEASTVRQPLLLAPPVAALSGSAGVVAQAPPRAVNVAGSLDGPVLLRLPEGRGVVWLLTAPALLDNAHIAKGDNRALLLNLAGRPGARVGFDEYQVPAGTAPSVPIDWLTQTVWGVALLFALLLLILYRWLAGRRLGPPVVPLADRYRPLTEYVVSLGGLLQRGKERKGVLRMYQRGLERDLKERFGPDYRIALDADTRNRIERLLATPDRLSEEELLRRAAEVVECEDDLRRIRV